MASEATKTATCTYIYQVFEVAFFKSEVIVARSSIGPSRRALTPRWGGDGLTDGCHVPTGIDLTPQHENKANLGKSFVGLVLFLMSDFTV